MAEIDDLVEGLGDDRKKAPMDFKPLSDLSSEMTIASPIDGVVLGRNVVPGDFYDKKDVLLILGSPTRVAPPGP